MIDHLLTPGTEHLDGFKNNETQKKEKHIYESLDKSQKLNETSKYIPGNAANYTTYSEFNHKYDRSSLLLSSSSYLFISFFVLPVCFTYVNSFS